MNLVNKIKCAALALASLVVAAPAHAVSYSFNFTSLPVVGVTVSGTFEGDLFSSFLPPNTFSGTITRSADSAADYRIVTGQISDLQVQRTSSKIWALAFNVVSGDSTAYYLFNLGGSTKTYQPNVYVDVTDPETQQTTNQLVTPLVAAKNQFQATFITPTDPATSVVAYVFNGSPNSSVTSVPEIDGSRLPQVALLAVAAWMVLRRRPAKSADKTPESFALA